MLLVCVLVAAASLPFGAALSYDAWGWLLWGRELVGPLPFSTAGYPSWKPLTALISIPLAPLGNAAPWLWLLTVRSSAAIAVLLAFRLGRRAAGSPAGALAAAALLLVPGWLFQAGVGGSEPLLTVLLLGALDRHLERHDGAGLALALMAALLRPESWPLLGVSAVVAWRRSPALRPWAVAAVVAVPLLWFGGDYLGSGSPFTGGHLARMSKQATAIQDAGSFPPLVVLRRSLSLAPPAILLGMLVALLAGARRRDPVLLVLGAVALGWTAEVAAMSALGYAGLERFLFPAAAAASIAGAVGLVMLIRSAPRNAAVRGALTAVALATVAIPGHGLVTGTGREAGMVEHRADIDQSLASIVATAGPRELGSTRHVSVEGVEATALAWRLGVSPRSLRRTHLPGLALELRDVPWPRLDQQVARHHLVVRPVARNRELSLVSVTRRQ